ncbi:MAG: helix-turn-helix domain-containing protein [Clostridia bacterium]|nr:helix-turn-helix domain-containing protein [Clostridia bacterium]
MFYYLGMNKFSERFKELRTEHGLSRANVAEKLNVSVRLVAYWENGERECDFDTLLAVAELFSTSVDYLLGKTEF